jgi:hypothetical protein
VDKQTGIQAVQSFEGCQVHYKILQLCGLSTEFLWKVTGFRGNTTNLTSSVTLAESLNTSMAVVKCLESLFGHGHKFWMDNSTICQISIFYETKMVSM